MIKIQIKNLLILFVAIAILTQISCRQDIEAKQQALDEKIEGLNDPIKLKIDSLQNIIDTLHKAIGDLTEDTSEAHVLFVKYANLQNAYKNLVSKISKLNVNDSQLEKQLADAKNETEKLQRDFDKLNDQNNTFSGLAAALKKNEEEEEEDKKEIEKLKASNKDLVTKNKQLESDAEKNKNMFTAMITDLKDQLSGYKKTVLGDSVKIAALGDTISVQIEKYQNIKGINVKYSPVYTNKHQNKPVKIKAGTSVYANKIDHITLNVDTEPIKPDAAPIHLYFAIIRDGVIMNSTKQIINRTAVKQPNGSIKYTTDTIKYTTDKQCGVSKHAHNYIPIYLSGLKPAKYEVKVYYDLQEAKEGETVFEFKTI